MRKKILLLCILCSHIANAQEAIESYSTLSDDVIVCKNGRRIPACKNIALQFLRAIL